MDLDYMAIAVQGVRFPVDGERLAARCRDFADYVSGRDDAADAAAKFRKFLQAISTGSKRRADSWPDLAKLAFWTARNAIFAWSFPVNGVPLREHRICWWTVSEEKRRIPGISLGLKLHPRIYLHAGKSLVMAPRWFLDARDLPFPDEPHTSKEWIEVAKRALNEYFRFVVISQSGATSQPLAYVHPAVKHLFKHRRLIGSKGLTLEGYTRGPDQHWKIGTRGQHPRRDR